MMKTPALKPQTYDEGSPNHSSMRVPPKGTKPVGFEPYKYAEDYDGAVKNPNPIAGQMSEEILKVGAKYYETQCAVCHGFHGEGGDKSPVGSKMNKIPPSLHSDKVKSWTDGQVYHVITMGQGLMGAYASHVPQKYRWQVVNYIRFLEKQNK